MKQVAQAVNDNRPLVIALSIIMLIISGGSNFAFDHLGRGSAADSLDDAVTKLTDLVERHDNELRSLQLWQAKTDADRYTSRDARDHSENQAAEFTKVYSEISSLRRDMLTEQRKAGEAMARTSEQLASVSKSIEDVRKLVAAQYARGNE